MNSSSSSNRFFGRLANCRSVLLSDDLAVGGIVVEDDDVVIVDVNVLNAWMIYGLKISQGL